MMNLTGPAILMTIALFSAYAITVPDHMSTAPSPVPPSPVDRPEVEPVEAQELRVRAVISAIDKHNRTLALQAPQGRILTLEVKDPATLDALKVGDLVVGTYVEAIAIEVKKTNSATTGPTRPGPRQVTVTATVTGVNKQTPSVTIKGPAGSVETLKVSHAKILAGVAAGDGVEITYTPALAGVLDRSTRPSFGEALLLLLTASRPRQGS